MFDLKMNLAYESALLRAKEEGHAKIYIEHILFELLGDAEFCDKLDAFDIEGNILARRNLLRLFMVLPRAQEGEPPRPSELTSELLERAQESGLFGLDDFFEFVLQNAQTLNFYAIFGANNFEFKAEDYFIDLDVKTEFEPFFGRSEELKGGLEVLNAAQCNSLIVVGKRGVGKDVFASELLRQILAQPAAANEGRGEVASEFRVVQVWLAPILAHCKYKGDFEERLEGILASFAQQKNVILYIKDAGLLASRSEFDAFDAMSVVRLYAINAAIRFVFCVSFEEFAYISKDKWLLNHAAQITLAEMTQEESVQVLLCAQSRFKRRFGVSFKESVCKAAVTAAKEHFANSALPHAALKLLTHAYSAFCLDSAQKFTPEFVEAYAKKAASLATQKPLTAQNSELYLALKSNLKKHIFGQDAAVDEVSELLLCSAAGFSESRRPRGVFLLAGKSGVGKTEFCIQLAKALDMHFERFDMSEYMERHMLGRFIGSPPGYIGFESGGVLTNAVKQNPRSVLLFDEIEKANSELVNLFLQIFDNATLTDGGGTKCDFKETIILMTSNLGSSGALQLGFTPQARQGEAKESLVTKASSGECKSKALQVSSCATLGAKSVLDERNDRAIREFFTPEFRNRIDAVIHFNALSTQALEQITHAYTTQLCPKAKLDDSAVGEILRLGKSSEFGGRNIHRVIKRHIFTKIAPKMLSGEVKKQVLVSFKNGEFVLKFS